jgi:hypothetical protein
MAGKIIADIIEAPFDSIKMNVANVTVLTANNSGLTYLPTGNVNINIGSTASLTLGNVTVSNLITASGGIKFPATQVVSDDANTLDDYEEGTFTPTISVGVGSITYSSQQGKYTKIGNVVYLRVNISLSAGTASGGHLTIAGLPFTVGTPAPACLGECNSSFFNSTSTNAPIPQIEGASTIIRFYKTNFTDFVGTDMNAAATARIQVSGFYYI